MAKIIVVGSGLAGLSAATKLVDYGHDVLVLEKNSYIGGRSASWNTDGMMVESGLHRYLGFYKHLPKLLKHVGVNINEIIAWEDAIEIRHPKYPYTTLGLSILHRPFLTIKSLLSLRLLSIKEKLLLIKFFSAGSFLYFKNPNTLDRYTVEEFAKNHGISRQTIEKILIPLTEGIFFLSISKYSAYAFFGLFLSNLARLPLTRVGAFNGGMSDVLMRPIADYILAKGGKIELNITVNKIHIVNNNVKGVYINGRLIEADAVILASSLGATQQIIKNSTKHSYFNSLLNLKTMPAVTVQFELSSPSINKDITTFGPTTSLASFAEQSRTTFKQFNGRLSVIMAEPEKYLNENESILIQKVIEDARKVSIDIKDKIINFKKITEPTDFYMLAPGAERLRPRQSTPITNLFLAGDYTKQKYLATMEGAVYSGQLAADLVGKN